LPPKPPEYYCMLNYPATILACEGGGFVAEIPDLPGCLTQGETLEEVWQNLAEAKRAWLEAACEAHLEIKEPGASA
jgi:antitoxin HicB